MRRGRGREKYRGKRGEGGRGRSIGGNEGEIDRVKNRQTDSMRETIIEQNVTILLYFLEEFLLAWR